MHDVEFLCGFGRRRFASLLLTLFRPGWFGMVTMGLLCKYLACYRACVKLSKKDEQVVLRKRRSQKQMAIFLGLDPFSRTCIPLQPLL